MSRRSPEAIRPQLKTDFFLRKATAGCYIMEPTSTTSKGASSRLKKALLQSVVQKLDCEVGRVTRDGQETAKELESGLEIVHRCFTERGNSILSVFSGE